MLHTGFLYEGKRQLGRWKDNINMDIKNWMVVCALDSSGSGYKKWRVFVHVVINLLVT